MKRVLITDGEERVALALVRSLGSAGYAPYVCSGRERCLAGASRHAIVEATVEDPLSDPQKFVASLERLVSRWAIDVLIPVTEAALLAVLGARDRFQGTCIPFADLEAFRRISDKALLLDIASSVGIAVPAQRLLEGRDQGLTELDSVHEYPVVLKPSRSVGEGNHGRVKLGVRHAANREELATALRELPDAAFPLLVQQRITGPGVGLFLLLWDGAAKAVFSHRRIREKPPAGGVSVYRESVAVDPELLARSRALLEQFDWRGVAMVEYKVDSRTGVPFLMEVNGRFWGSLQLAVDAGVDFPRLLLDAAFGVPIQPVPRYHEGVRSRWWWGDVDQLVTRLRRSGAELALPPGTPGRWGAIKEFMALWRPGDRNEIFQIRDPWPLVRESVDWIRGR